MSLSYAPGLKSGDTRRWQKDPHLKCSLEYLDKILDYLKKVEINEYKRRQAPVGIRVTHRGFGKDWRYPITGKFRA